MTLGVLQRYLKNQGDAWQYTLDVMGQYYEDVLIRQAAIDVPRVSSPSLLDLVDEPVPEQAKELIGIYLETAQLLGQRTAELHVALAQATDNPDFAPEPFTDFYRRGLYQSMIGQANQTLQLLRQRLSRLPASTQDDAQQVLACQPTIRRQLQALRDRRIAALRIRCHGDYHLGQVLCTGRDFAIIDFEGEPARSLSVRRMKRSPLRDVAGMLRSFHYAAYAALLGQISHLRPEDYPVLEPWAQFWYAWVATTFLRAYLDVAAQERFLPPNPEHLRILLTALLLDKAFYELGYELNSRPDWVRIPLQGILQLTAPED